VRQKEGSVMPDSAVKIPFRKVQGMVFLLFSDIAVCFEVVRSIVSRTCCTIRTMVFQDIRHAV